MLRALVGSGRLGSGCLVLRADTQENPAGKNGVMTLPNLLSLFSTIPQNIVEEATWMVMAFLLYLIGTTLDCNTS